MPSCDEQTIIVDKTIKVSDNIFLMPSMSDEGVQYLVDMNTGICQCKIGINGSPCKHQYILWVNKLCVAVNFLPVFSREQRQMYAEVAIGSTLPLHFYEGLHDQVLALPDPGTPSCFPPSGAEASNETNITPTGNYIICLVSE